MAGLDVTLTVTLDLPWIDDLAARLAGRPVAVLADLLVYYERGTRARTTLPGTPVHDALAVARVTHPHLVAGVRRPVQVVTDGPTRGMTLVDRRPARHPDPPNALVIEWADAAGLRDLIAATLDADLSGHLRSPPMGAPLEGIRVVEVGLLVQGPQAAATLAEWGADVVKVELPGFGDQSRWLPSSRTEPRSGYFHGCNRGKRSITLDLRRPEGAEVFLRLVERADVVISNFKPGTMEEWGVGYEAAAAAQPAGRLRHRLDVRHPWSRRRPGGRRPRRPGRRRAHQHDRRRPPGPDPGRLHAGRPHRRPEPRRRRPRRAASPAPAPVAASTWRRRCSAARCGPRPAS